MWALLLQLHAVALETNSVMWFLLHQSVTNIWVRKPYILKNLVPSHWTFVSFPLNFSRITLSFDADLQRFKMEHKFSIIHVTLPTSFNRQGF